MEIELIIDHIRSYLCDEASIKITKVQGWESFWVGQHIHVPAELCNPTPQRQRFLHSESFHTLYAFLHLTIHLYPLLCPLLNNKLVNVSSHFTEFCESFQKIIKIMKRAVGTWIYSWSVKSTEINLGLSLTSEVGTVLWMLSC